MFIKGDQSESAVETKETREEFYSAFYSGKKFPQATICMRNLNFIPHPQRAPQKFTIS